VVEAALEADLDWGSVWCRPGPVVDLDLSARMMLSLVGLMSSGCFSCSLRRDSRMWTGSSTMTDIASASRAAAVALACRR
jgi:hypothetical protein